MTFFVFEFEKTISNDEKGLNWQICQQRGLNEINVGGQILGERLSIHIQRTQLLSVVRCLQFEKASFQTSLDELMVKQWIIQIPERRGSAVVSSSTSVSSDLRRTKSSQHRLYSNQPIFEDSPFLHRSISQPPSLNTPQENFFTHIYCLRIYKSLNYLQSDNRMWVFSKVQNELSELQTLIWTIFERF